MEISKIIFGFAIGLPVATFVVISILWIASKFSGSSMPGGHKKRRVKKLKRKPIVNPPVNNAHHKTTRTSNFVKFIALIIAVLIVKVIVKKISSGDIYQFITGMSFVDQLISAGVMAILVLLGIVFWRDISGLLAHTYREIRTIVIGIWEDLVFIMEVKGKIKEAIKKHGYKSHELEHLITEYYYALSAFSGHLAIILIASSWPINNFLGNAFPVYSEVFGIKFNVVKALAFEVELMLGLGLVAYWTYTLIEHQEEVKDGHWGLQFLGGILVDIREAGEGNVMTTPIVPFIRLKQLPKEFRVEFNIGETPIISASGKSSINPEDERYSGDILHKHRLEISKSKVVAICEITDGTEFMKSKISLDDVKVNITHLLSTISWDVLGGKFSYAQINDLIVMITGRIECRLTTELSKYNNGSFTKSVVVKNIALYDLDYDFQILGSNSRVLKRSYEVDNKKPVTPAVVQIPAPVVQPNPLTQQPYLKGTSLFP